MIMTKQSTGSKYFHTTDLALASAVSLFFPLESIDKRNPQKAFFLFKQNGELDQLVKQYWQQELKIEPQAYYNQLKMIKARLYSE